MNTIETEKSNKTANTTQFAFIFCVMFLSIFAMDAVVHSLDRSKAPTASRAHAAIFRPSTDTNFAFGAVPIGTSMQKTFTYTNTGTDTLFIQSLELNADSAFTIQFATLTLPPNRSGKVIVQFAPTAAQVCRGSIAFDVANGVASPTLSLSGTGAFPTGTSTSLLTGTAGGQFQQADH